MCRVDSRNNDWLLESSCLWCWFGVCSDRVSWCSWCVLQCWEMWWTFKRWKLCWPRRCLQQWYGRNNLLLRRPCQDASSKGMPPTTAAMYTGKLVEQVLPRCIHRVSARCAYRMARCVFAVKPHDGVGPIAVVPKIGRKCRHALHASQRPFAVEELGDALGVRVLHPVARAERCPGNTRPLLLGCPAMRQWV